MKKVNTFQIFTNIYIGLFLFGFISLLIIEKGDLVYLLNGIHTPFLDYLFKHTTHIGHGILFVPLILALLFIRYKYAIAGLMVAVGHGLILSFLKKVVFKGAPRPTAFLTDTSGLHFVEGVKVHTSNSFPSGHTATAFAFCLFLTFLINKRSWGALLLFLAILGGASRIYLLQHFYIDVVVGGFIGSIVAILSWKWVLKESKFTWIDMKINLKK